MITTWAKDGMVTVTVWDQPESYIIVWDCYIVSTFIIDAIASIFFKKYTITKHDPLTNTLLFSTYYSL